MALDHVTRNRILACPPLFLLHEAEEYRTMLPWIAKHESLVPHVVKSIVPHDPAFIAYAGAIFLVLFVAVGIMASRSKPQSVPWLLLAILLTARLENAVLHTIESIVLMQYTPGFITAVIVVLPISFYLLRRLIRLDLVRLSWLPGIIAAGFIVQAVGIGAMLLLGSI